MVFLMLSSCTVHKHNHKFIWGHVYSPALKSNQKLLFTDLRKVEDSINSYRIIRKGNYYVDTIADYFHEVIYKDNNLVVLFSYTYSSHPQPYTVVVNAADHSIKVFEFDDKLAEYEVY